jgi:hypothetical protein
MSLTSHIKDVDSPIREWLDSSLPNLGEALKTLRADMPRDLDARTIRPGAGVPPGTLGTAIDYRIRYHLAITPSEVRIPRNSPTQSTLNSPSCSAGFRPPSEAAPAADAKRQRVPLIITSFCVCSG